MVPLTRQVLTMTHRQVRVAGLPLVAPEHLNVRPLSVVRGLGAVSGQRPLHTAVLVVPAQRARQRHHHRHHRLMHTVCSWRMALRGVPLLVTHQKREKIVRFCQHFWDGPQTLARHVGNFM